jgi:outer membrane receptor protein involved in Fe transport
VSLLFAAPAWTDPTKAFPPKPFDVAVQPLDTALSRLADQAGVQIAFVGAQVRGHLSHPVHGVMPPLQAFRIAAGSGYDVIVSGPDTYVVRAAAAPAATRHTPLAAANPASPPPDAPPRYAPPQEIIVTARMSPVPRTRLDSSYAVTRLNDEVIRMSGAESAADLLKAVPGLWVESSGGEASNNVRARGIPRDGYSSLALFEDGLPLQHDPGLGYLNADQSFRVDDTTAAIEVVRGGPSSVFASNSLGGMVNLITRAPPDHAELRLRAQGGDRDYRRADLWGGGPLGQWRVAAGGFYRADDGLRPTGYQADDGGQWRITARRDFEGGSLDLDYKRIDDHVAFYLPIPLQQSGDGTITPLPGFNAFYGTLEGPDTAAAGLRDARGQPYPFDLTKGTQVRLDQYTVKWRQALGVKGALSESLRYRRSSTWRNGLFPGFPDTAANKLKPYLAPARGIYPNTDHLGLVYADTGLPFSGALAIDGTLSSVRVPLDELISDTRYEGHAGGHNITAGVYMAHVETGMKRLTATVGLEVASQARRLDIVAFDAAGHALGAITSGGITRYGAQFDDYTGAETSTAIYGTDEWQIGAKWRADIGVRLEHLALGADVEQSATFKGPDALHIGDDAVLGGTGTFSHLARAFDGQTLSVGLTRPLGADTQVYGRVTRTQYMPNVSDLEAYPSLPPRTEPALLSEIGVQRTTPSSDVHVVIFSTAFSGYRVTDNVFDAASNAYVQKVAYSNTLTNGVEIEGLWRPGILQGGGHRDGFDLAFAATLQDPRFRGLKYTEIVYGVPVPHDFTGNRLLRVPNLMARLTPGLTFAHGRGRLEATVEYYGDRFTDAANTQRLPPYAVLNAALRYALTPHLTLSVTGDNLGQTLGLTEGNPRAGEFISADAATTYFAARPIFGRTVRAALAYRF